MNLRTSFILLLTFFICDSLMSQIVHEDYYDGKMYFKFKNDSDKVIQNLETLNLGTHDDIALILNKYGIIKLERPFIVLKTETFDRTYEIEFADYLNIEQMIKELEQLPYMEYAEKVPIMRSTYTPNDPDQGTQYSLNLINAEQAWDIHKGGNATVAIVDDAVYVGHQDLAPNVWVNPNEIPSNGIDDDNNGYVDDINGWDAADNDPDPAPPATQTATGAFTHGTHCAGIASGATDNGIGMASIGFNTKIISVKGKADNHTGDGLPDIWAGFTYAIASGADVISCSWGGGGASTTHQNLVTTAYGNGHLVIAAAGNDGDDVPHYPSAYPNVFAVANTNQNDQKNGSSNYGDWVDISAPGTAIYSTLADSPLSFGNQTGTSMACPMVAGLAALMKSLNPFLTNAEIEDCIKNTAIDINELNPTFFGLLGAGRIDAFAAIQCAAPSSSPIIQISTNSNSNNISCPGESITFFDNSFYDPDSWQWTFPGGTPATSTEQNPTVYYPTPGNYDVVFEATNEFGTSTETFTSYVNIDGSVTSNAFSEDFESGNMFGWTVENPTGGAQWKVESISGGLNYGDYALSINNFDNNYWGARDAVISPPISLYGRSTAILEMDYAYRRHIQGESDSLIIKASLDGGNTFPITLFADADDGNYSVATYVILNGSFIPNNDIDWCGQGTVGAGCLSFDISSYISSATDFRIKFENYSKQGNNFYIDNIRVVSDCVSNSVVPLADFEADRMGCNSLTTTFSDISIGVADTWAWTFTGGTPATSTERNPEVTYDTPGSYEVSLTVSNATGSNTITKSDYIVISTGMPTADFDLSAASWNSVIFNNNSTDGVEYIWDFGDGTTSNEESPYHSYPDVGEDYTVELTVINGCGSSTSSQVITTTSNEDSFGEDASFNVFPNPNNGQFTIEISGKSNETANLLIFDMLGRNIRNTTSYISSDTWRSDMDLSGITKGTYIIKVNVGDSSTFKKILIH